MIHHDGGPNPGVVQAALLWPQIRTPPQGIRHHCKSRNAGGRASDDAIRSLVISYKFLDTKELFVFHHTDCGMETFDDATMHRLLNFKLDTFRADENSWHDHGTSPGSAEGDYTPTVTADVKRIREHPLVLARIPIYGFVYDVKTGRLNEVAETTELGKAG